MTDIVERKYGTDIGHAAALVQMWNGNKRQLESQIMDKYVQGVILEQQAREALVAIGTLPKKIAEWFELNPINAERDTHRRRGYQEVANDPHRDSTFAERDEASKFYSEWWKEKSKGTALEGW